MKPILFNTPMTQAILDGRKTETRRLVHPAHIAALQYPARLSHPEMTDLEYLNRYASSKYYVGDILYVRETFGYGIRFDDYGQIYYRADENAMDAIQWHPSIHMPKEAARIFLRVTDARVERLQDITCDDAKAEGANVGIGVAEKMRETAIDRFARIWNSTVKPADLDRYGWDANPFVWVYEFERISREEAYGSER